MFTHKSSAEMWLRQSVAAHIPGNATTYKSRVLTISLGTNSLGCKVDIEPFTGLVVESNQDFAVLKTGRTEFWIIDPSVLREPLTKGATICVTPYARRSFDGNRLNAPVLKSGDSGFTMSAIGKSVSEIPVEPPKSDLGKHLLDTLQRARCPDGVRVLSNMLVDIGAMNFVFIDPDDADPTDARDMQFIFDCSNRNFSGRVTVGIDSSLDLFYLEMHKVYPEAPEKLQHRCEGIPFDSLAEVMSTLLCDGEWKFAKIDVLKSPKFEANQACLAAAS